MTIVKTDSVGPMPKPVMNIHAHMTGKSVRDVRPVSRKMPRVMIASAPVTIHL